MSILLDLMKRLRGPAVELSSTMRLVLIAVADFADLDGGAYPSLPTIATITGLGRRAVVKATADLEAAGWLSRETKKGIKTTYTIHLPVIDVHQCSPTTSASSALVPVHVVHGTSAPRAPESLKESERESEGRTRSRTKPGEEDGDRNGRQKPVATPQDVCRETSGNRGSDPHPRHRELYAAWLSTAEAAYGEKPATGGNQGGRIAKSIADLLKAYGGNADRALATMRRAVQDRRRPTIHQIARDPDGYGPIATTRPTATATPLSATRRIDATHPDQLLTRKAAS